MPVSAEELISHIMLSRNLTRSQARRWLREEFDRQQRSRMSKGVSAAEIRVKPENTERFVQAGRTQGLSPYGAAGRKEICALCRSLLSDFTPGCIHCEMRKTAREARIIFETSGKEIPARIIPSLLETTILDPELDESSKPRYSEKRESGNGTHHSSDGEATNPTTRTRDENTGAGAGRMPSTEGVPVGTGETARTVAPSTRSDEIPVSRRSGSHRISYARTGVCKRCLYDRATYTLGCNACYMRWYTRRGKRSDRNVKVDHLAHLSERFSDVAVKRPKLNLAKLAELDELGETG